MVQTGSHGKPQFLCFFVCLFFACFSLNIEIDKSAQIYAKAKIEYIFPGFLEWFWSRENWLKFFLSWKKKAKVIKHYECTPEPNLEKTE